MISTGVNLYLKLSDIGATGPKTCYVNKLNSTSIIFLSTNYETD